MVSYYPVSILSIRDADTTPKATIFALLARTSIIDDSAFLILLYEVTIIST